MRITDALAAIPALEVTGPTDGDVTSITYNSAEVQPGACFVAIRGKWRDGHAYIADALARGARMIVGVDAAPADLPPDRLYARVADSRRELGALAAALAGHPSARLAVVGVTGTDGKTTTTNLIDAILEAGGIQCGLMSTVDFKAGGVREQNNSRFTTLEAPEVQQLLARIVESGAQCAVLETTSSGLALYRVHGVAYDVAVVTNITSEHLELHGTKEAYWRAKAMLCEAIDPAATKALPQQPPKACVLNADDSSYTYLRGFCAAPIISYSMERPADVSAERLDLRADGSRFDVRLPDGATFTVETPLVAAYNVANCLAAIAVGYLFRVSPERMARALATFPGVPGRMERIEMGQPFSVVVDYAHTADSLEKVLRVLRPLTRGNLIAVFGSAGDRDRVKRPAMGAVAARLADFSFITDEDPREEDAASILREIAAGAEQAGASEGERFRCIVGRRAGIGAAFARAREGDTVLLAGKGHEQSLIIGKEKLPWDDRRVAREELSALGYTDAPPATKA
ncbi:MAG TPA: UDP-N-acetylmuramoyl-L-alanyl-D-glutamate--2,6-diaminopimelate ligase [Ktedonobacterales bacterium]|nr:UDP-N-acetylmuramoyl-L-alanyl-D-glutamate--2,6-diaminopimelate ligase [Ktedonobacterales bacterium]